MTLLALPRDLALEVSARLGTTDRYHLVLALLGQQEGHIQFSAVTLLHFVCLARCHS